MTQIHFITKPKWWNKPGDSLPGGPTPPPLPLCFHLGPVLPHQRGSCAFKRFKCDVFGQCTQRKCDKAEHSCEGCPRYEPDA